MNTLLGYINTLYIPATLICILSTKIFGCIGPVIAIVFTVLFLPFLLVAIINIQSENLIFLKKFALYFFGFYYIIFALIIAVSLDSIGLILLPFGIGVISILFYSTRQYEKLSFFVQAIGTILTTIILLNIIL